MRFRKGKAFWFLCASATLLTLDAMTPGYGLIFGLSDLKKPTPTVLVNQPPTQQQPQSDPVPASAQPSPSPSLPSVMPPVNNQVPPPPIPTVPARPNVPAGVTPELASYDSNQI